MSKNLFRAILLVVTIGALTAVGCQSSGRPPAASSPYGGSSTPSTPHCSSCG